MKLSDAQIDALDAAEKAATPGPWKHDIGNCDIETPRPERHEIVVRGEHGNYFADLDFIALARNSLRPLLDELRLLRALATAIDNYYLEGELATIEANEALAALRKLREADGGG